MAHEIEKNVYFKWKHPFQNPKPRHTETGGGEA